MPSRARIRLAVTSSASACASMRELSGICSRIPSIGSFGRTIRRSGGTREGLVRANVILAVAVAAAAAAGCDGAAQAKKSDAKDVLPVDVVTVQRIELRRSVEAVGTLAAHDQATVSAEVSGRVARLAVDMGDKV